MTDDRTRTDNDGGRDQERNRSDDERGIGLTASASRTGYRADGDDDDIGSTDEMRASTGGLAGTSR